MKLTLHGDMQWFVGESIAFTIDDTQYFGVITNIDINSATDECASVEIEVIED